MNAALAIQPSSADELPSLLRGDTERLTRWMDEPGWRPAAWCVAVIVLGAGIYGGTIGLWRAPLQACYTAIKFPLILLLTALGNGLINSMLAPLLGLSLGFRQSILAVLMSFAIAAAILGAFGPLVLFMVWNLPPLASAPEEVSTAFNVIKLSQVVVIAFAGIAANARLLQLLHRLSGRPAVARNVLVAWLAVNLLLGAQWTWILRPLFGAPHLDVEFLRPNAFEGNFYETVFHALKYFLTS